MNRSIEAINERAKRGFSDFLQLDPSRARARAGGLSDWLVGEVRRAIADGRLPTGSRLPASRVLAAELQVSRGVVTEAYQRLSENGQVVGHARAGTVIAAVPAPAQKIGRHRRRPLKRLISSSRRRAPLPSTSSDRRRRPLIFFLGCQT